MEGIEQISGKGTRGKAAIVVAGGAGGGHGSGGAATAGGVAEGEAVGKAAGEDALEGEFGADKLIEADGEAEAALTIDAGKSEQGAP